MEERSLVGRSALLATLGERIGEGVGIVLAGPAGVGKSSLLTSIAVGAQGSRRVERMVATEPMRGIAFGPLLSLLPEGSDDRGRALAAVRERLVERTGQRRTLVAVDDGHLLDDASLACILDIAHRGDAVVVVTVRDGDEVPAALTGLWTSGVVERVPVPPLEDDAVALLVESVLDGPVDAALAGAVIAVADGNPLLARELVLDARDSGVVVCFEGRWCLDGDLAPGRRVQEIAQGRVSGLGAPAVELAEVIAAVEPVDVALVDADPGVLDLLERRSLVRIEANGDRLEARSDHPLIGEALRSGMSARREQQCLGVVARRAIERGFGQRGDAVRAARWCRRSGVPVPIELAVAGAAEAADSLDLDFAVELVEGALADADTWELHFQRGDLHRLLADADDAERSFARASALADDDDAVAVVAERRAWVHSHLLSDPRTTVQVLEDAARRVADPYRRGELERSASNFAGLLEGFDEVRRTNRELLATADPDSDEARAARRNLAYAQATLGDTDGLVGLVDRALADGAAPDVDDMLRGIRCSAHLLAGALEEGERQASTDVRSCRDRAELHGSVGVRLGLLLHVRASDAVHDELAAVGRELDRTDPFGLRVRHHSVWAAALADCARIEEANELLDRVADEPADVRSMALLGRARAATMARSGATELACEIAHDVGYRAIAATQVADGLLVLHEATRHGRPDLVVEALTATATEIDGRGQLLRAIAADAVAARAQDGKAVASVADDYASMGARLLAADAMARAAEFLAREDDGRDARRLDAVARLLAADIGSFVVDPSPVEGGLTDRELDVAVAAAKGHASRDIADVEFLSVRTVDNHLRRVYRKLDVAGRPDLAELLRPYC